MGNFSSVIASIFASAVLISSLAGCGEKQKAVEQLSPKAQYERDAQVLSMFSGVALTDPMGDPMAPSGIDSKELLSEKNYLIKIPKLALRIVDQAGKTKQKETEFLLSASMIPQAGAATSTAMNGKVIYFQLFEDGLDMYESTEGAVVTGDLPARMLLAKFPISSQDANHVIIDFDRGMKSLFVSDWTSGGTEFDESALVTTVDTPTTRVQSVTHTPGRLTISQTVQAHLSMFGTAVSPSLEARYFLTPYQKTAFVPKTVKQTRHVRYFKSYPNLEESSGISRTHILKFDITNPVTFAYSANTPPEFEEAVKEGILYWNRAFGKEVVKVVKAPEGVTAPNPELNIVQWVPWDSAGFAYADVIADPRTGRSLHGQAYMTSVFGLKGIDRARIALRQLQALAEKPAEAPKKNPVFNGLSIRFLSDKTKWTPGGHCEQHSHEAASAMAKGITAMLALDNVTDQRILDMSRNYVREVVAHEVGHIFGLRHHFAASLGATLSAKEQAEWAKVALTEGKFDSIPDKHSATSVMEYTEYFAAAYIGQKIKEGKEVLPYDKDAIQWGYFDNNAVVDNKTLYCSDEEAAGMYGDCERFDPTGDPFLGTHTDIVRAVQQLPGLFLEQFVAAVAPADAIDLKKVEEVNLTAGFALSPVATALRRALMYFNNDVKLVAIDNQFPFLGPMNEEARLDARWDDLQKRIARIGGTDRLLFSHLPLNLTIDASQTPEGVIPTAKFSREGFVKKVGELLAGTYSKFIGLDGKEHSFSETEKKLIQERATQYAEFYETQLLKLTLTAFSSTKLSLSRDAVGITDDENVLAKIEKQYVAVAREVITAQNPAKTKTGKVRGAQITIVDFKYPTDVRTLAAGILNRNLGSQPFWADDARPSIRNQLKSQVEGPLLVSDLANFKDSDLSRSLRTWLVEQRTILALLPD